MDLTTTTAKAAQRIGAAITERVQRVVAVGEDVLEPILAALLARGHVLIEGIPGIGKTLLARTLARCVDCQFRRIQFTNDLMPSDIVGSAVWKQGVERFVFVRGPLFANVVLADEINRTSPRSLSCLLEAMENGRVSVEGRTEELGRPFLVLATRNPIEFHGTFPIPEAALDRFMARVEMAYPDASREMELYMGGDREERLQVVEPLLSREELIGLMESVEGVSVREPVADYCYRVVTSTRNHPDVALGASPRAAILWLRAARARALLKGRDYVLPDDLKHLARPVLAHRVFLQGGGPAHPVVREVLDGTEVPL